MALRFEAYTAEGSVSGTVGTDDRLGDVLERDPTITAQRAEVVAIHGSAYETPRIALATDDLLAVVAPPSVGVPVHATWHDVTIFAGPYRIDGLLPTMPGFDPGRALARPTGSFLLLGKARVALAAEPTAGSAEHELLWVNRYTVDRVEADLDLGFFFPGARTSVTSTAGRVEGSAPPRVAEGAPR